MCHIVHKRKSLCHYNLILHKIWQIYNLVNFIKVTKYYCAGHYSKTSRAFPPAVVVDDDGSKQGMRTEIYKCVNSII